MRLFQILLLLCVSLPIVGQGPPITVGTPVMLGLEGKGVRSFAHVSVFDEGRLMRIPIGLPYNITPTWQIGAVLPYVLRATAGESIKEGIGDVTVFTKFQLFKRDGRGKTFRTIVILRHTLPSGRAFDGTAFSSGAFATSFGIISGYITTRYGLYFDASYIARSQQLPDLWRYNLSIGIPLLPHRYPQRQLNAYLELNALRSADFQLQSLMLSPGLQVIPGRRFLIEASFGYPVVQPPNATLRYTTLAGIRFLL